MALYKVTTLRHEVREYEVEATDRNEACDLLDAYGQGELFPEGAKLIRVVEETEYVNKVSAA